MRRRTASWRGLFVRGFGAAGLLRAREGCNYGCPGWPLGRLGCCRAPALAGFGVTHTRGQHDTRELRLHHSKAASASSSACVVGAAAITMFGCPAHTASSVRLCVVDKGCNFFQVPRAPRYNDESVTAGQNTTSTWFRTLSFFGTEARCWLPGRRLLHQCWWVPAQGWFLPNTLRLVSSSGASFGA